MENFIDNWSEFEDKIERDRPTRFFKDVSAGKTFIWNRPEQNLVYLMSEFIDNSKSTYESMLSKNPSIEDKLPIKIVFNQKLEFIKFQDFGEGFDIEKAISSIGQEKERIGQTNQYYVGMKTAMNYFGNFSIIVSERNFNGVNRRFVNYFIYNRGCSPQVYELKPSGRTGSEIYLFSNWGAAANFWRDLPFKEEQKSRLFPPEELVDVGDLESATNTEKILKNLKIIFPFISASLFERYSYLVNQVPQIEILFNLYDERGIDINTKNNSWRLEVPKNLNYPQFYTKIVPNDWQTTRSFSFRQLFTTNERNDTRCFMRQLNNSENLEFRRHFEKMLFNDVKHHFSEAKREWSRFVDSFELEDLGKELNYDYEWISHPLESEGAYEFLEEDLWNTFPLAKKFASIFMLGLTKKTGNLSHIKIKIPNLCLTNDEIKFSYSAEDESFDLVFDFNIFSYHYADRSEDFWGPIQVDNCSGFSLVQNNRAIYHGPNFKPLHPEYVSWFQKWPSKFLETELKNAQPQAFPYYLRSKHHPTYVSIGGNTIKWSSKIFGTIFLPEGNIFNPGTNKINLSNLKALKEFSIKVLRDSAINVLSRWVHLIDNRALNGEPKHSQIKEYNRGKISKREGIIILDILHTIYKNKQAKEKALNLETGHRDFTQPKNPLENKVSTELASAILGKEGVFTPQLVEKDKKSVTKYAVDFLKLARNNEWSTLKIKKIELSDDYKEILILLNNSFHLWNKSLLISFDSQQSVRDKWTYKLMRNEPIMIKIPLDVSNTDIPSLKNLINKQLLSLYHHLSNIIGFYNVSTKRKINSKFNSNQIEEMIESYMNFALNHITTTAEKVDFYDG